ncbi:hypothetical protein NXS19_002727 [Fusarium pseudograminearum]|nr:hypothetical protein NXS19_002727 [Fusarium pseudograminearum]
MQWNKLRWCTFQPNAVHRERRPLDVWPKTVWVLARQGGRPWAAGISDDICHLLKILDEKDGKLEETYIELWEEWVQARDTVEPGQESN